MKLPGRPTLYRLQARFELEYIARKHSYHAVARRIELLVEYFGKDKEAGDVTREMVRHYRAWLAEKKKLAPSTIQLYCSCASSFYTWMMLMEVEGVVFNPFTPMADINLYRKNQTMHKLISDN
jgi:Phage integrase, N-terminal SAM-like domain